MTYKYFLILMAVFFVMSSIGASMSFQSGYERGMYDTLTESCELIEVGELTDADRAAVPE